MKFCLPCRCRALPLLIKSFLQASSRSVKEAALQCSRARLCTVSNSRAIALYESALTSCKPSIVIVVPLDCFEEFKSRVVPEITQNTLYLHTSCIWNIRQSSAGQRYNTRDYKLRKMSLDCITLSCYATYRGSMIQPCWPVVTITYHQSSEKSRSKITMPSFFFWEIWLP